jgi:hypothetical protein
MFFGNEKSSINLFNKPDWQLLLTTLSSKMMARTKRGLEEFPSSKSFKTWDGPIGEEFKEYAIS